MTQFRLQFAGKIVKADRKNVNGRTVVECSLCRKISREGQPEEWMWIRVNVWEPAEFQDQHLVKGGFLAGSGGFVLRSYEKDGQPRQSAEVRCQSFDVEAVGMGTGPASPALPAATSMAQSEEAPF
jgi:single-stranded DNA-binding protein